MVASVFCSFMAMIAAADRRFTMLARSPGTSLSPISTASMARTSSSAALVTQPVNSLPAKPTAEMPSRPKDVR